MLCMGEAVSAFDIAVLPKEQPWLIWDSNRFYWLQGIGLCTNVVHGTRIYACTFDLNCSTVGAVFDWGDESIHLDSLIDYNQIPKWCRNAIGHYDDHDSRDIAHVWPRFLLATPPTGPLYGGRKRWRSFRSFDYLKILLRVPGPLHHASKCWWCTCVLGDRYFRRGRPYTTVDLQA